MTLATHKIPELDGLEVPGDKLFVITQEELSGFCEYWQKSLNLGEWRIFAKFVPYSELCKSSKSSCSGDVNWMHEQRFANIRIVRAEDREQLNSSAYFAYDAEAILVHELLHLKFVDWESASIESPGYHIGVQEERAINDLAGALVRLRRMGNSDQIPGDTTG